MAKGKRKNRAASGSTKNISRGSSTGLKTVATSPELPVGPSKAVRERAMVVEVTLRMRPKTAQIILPTQRSAQILLHANKKSRPATEETWQAGEIVAGE
jgi:hypothetical protein